ncbi:type III secretion system chaperone [Variovorax soli]|uniref:Tir chaperone protein (CesT) family protein n=1 Tax=Variovorax soli TaxID=376815 RepID=A0ABU1NIM6_9BURK|nr:type III secretion system chaperone [Variovorax soli]MDR6537721.1 hypothetical protein [Variovorax soli]
MNHTKFQDVCVNAARALRADATEQDGRCSLTIDVTEVPVDLDEDAHALHCYVNLGDANSLDRMDVCEQLLALNLRTHVTHYGTYALEPASAWVIFCANLQDATTLNGEKLAQMLRYYLHETKEVRQMVGGISEKYFSTVFAGDFA